MSKWDNYKQAPLLPDSYVEEMWRTLDRIAEACEMKHPGDVNFMSKDAIRAAAMRASPSYKGRPNAQG